jgi:hypothetical protein
MEAFAEPCGAASKIRSSPVLNQPTLCRRTGNHGIADIAMSSATKSVTVLCGVENQRQPRPLAGGRSSLVRPMMSFLAHSEMPFART